MTRFIVLLFVFSFFRAVVSALGQDHGHFYVGATGKMQGDRLTIENGPDFSTNINYVKTLTYTNSGRYAGYFQGNITFEVLPSTNALGDAVPGGPALGSWIHAQIVSVEGPAGGAFNFWESGATAPTLTIPTGTSSTNTWVISANNGVAGTDPFGHIHGRRFTATIPGLYVVSFRVLDFSNSGNDGGSIHLDSELLTVYFQAGINLVSITRTNEVSTVTFGGMANRSFQLEAADAINATNWVALGTVPGEDYLISLTETNASPRRFYRLRVTQP